MMSILPLIYDVSAKLSHVYTPAFLVGQAVN